jgi:hypothetical protein
MLARIRTQLSSTFSISVPECLVRLCGSTTRVSGQRGVRRTLRDATFYVGRANVLALVAEQAGNQVE